MQVVYDPARISYAQLLDVFWQLHDPTSAPYLRQYRNAIFYLDNDQKRTAEASRRAVEEKLGRPVRTAIEAAGTFTPAEDYHQKHYLQGNKPLMDVLRKRFGSREELFRSTDAAHLNGMLGCNGDPERLGLDIRALNLPQPLEQELFDGLSLTCPNFHAQGCALPPLPAQE